MKVMLVDDNPGIREVIKQIIEEEIATPCTFIELDDGETVVETYADCRPDWVFMDIKMKRMDGLTATTSLMRRFPDARVVIVSQYDDAAYRMAAEQQGVFAYILKDNLLDIPALMNSVFT
ncbi:response regulator transcription factor [bacterium]|nr:response regulator transcription factor [bacterium]